MSVMAPAASFKAALSLASAMSVDDDLHEAMAELPDDLKRRIARGPVPRRWSCGVCDAFGAAFYRGVVNFADPRWRVWLYHEAPKAQMTHRDHLHYGELANETYRRCLTTYRAAGWTGEAGEPDA